MKYHLAAWYCSVVYKKTFKSVFYWESRNIPYLGSDTDHIITDRGVTREIQTRNIPGPQTYNRKSPKYVLHR